MITMYRAERSRSPAVITQIANSTVYSVYVVYTL